MRMCCPTFHVETYTLKLDLCDLFFGEYLFDDPIAASHLPRLLTSINVGAQSNNSVMNSSDLSSPSRFLLNHRFDSIGLLGLLVLLQSFGAIYLGETFCSYISINNSSNFDVRDVIIKAEIKTEKQRILLLDTSKSPVVSIRASGIYDFIVEHDVKELGGHTLCALHFIVTMIVRGTISHSFSSSWFLIPSQLERRKVFKEPVLIKAGGGIYNYLYQLRLSSHDSVRVKLEGSNVLGSQYFGVGANGLIQ